MEESAQDVTGLAQQERQLIYDKLSIFYMFLPYMLLGQLLGALLLSVLVYNEVEIYFIGVWMVLNILIVFYRLYHYRLFRNASETKQVMLSRMWFNRFATDVFVSGVVWGSAAFIIFPATSAVHQVIMLLLLGTIGWTSLGVLASKKWLLLLYISVVLFPMIVRLFLLQDSQHQTIAFFGLALMLIAVLTAYYYGGIINKALEAYQENFSTKHSFRRLQNQFFALFKQAPVGIFHFDDQLMIHDANAHFVKMATGESKGGLSGMRLEHLWPDATVLEMHKRILMDLGEQSIEAPISATFGDQTFHLTLSSAPVHDGDGAVVGGITILKDATGEVQAKDALKRVMHYDILTDLPNRTLLLQRLKVAIDLKLHTGIFGGLLFLDIDHFNNINRAYGQKAGDRILQKIATQLEQITANRGTVSRIGADTFAILLPVLTEEREKSQEEVIEFVNTLRKAFEKVVMVGDADYHINFTVGVALFDTNTDTPLDILKYAESTMFSAKNTTRGSIRFYEKERDKSILNDMQIANDIYRAIRNNELTVYYQPQQDIHTGILTGAEALVRWNHPQKGSISPAHFIPIAEESGAIIRLEEWIFEQVFKDMHTMASSLIEFPLNYIAVNVSSVHFLQPNFIEKFVTIVHRYRINPLWVNIEITESGLMGNIEDAIRRIHELKRLGFGFSIDDFGTGYSSLTYLKKLPVDIIKIDRSFVKDADRSEEDRLIVESVIEISRKFGFKVLAEGIDRQETLDYFRGTGCKTFQGYLFYKPISMDEFIQLI